MAFYNYGDIAKATGGATKSGLHTVYLAPLSYLASIAVPTGPFTGAGDSVTISSNHTATNNGGFIKALGMVKKKVTATGSTIGELGSRKMQWEVTVPVAGIDAALLELVDGGLNEEWIVLSENGCNEGAYLQFGCECEPAELMVDGDTGTQDGGFKGLTLKFTATGTPFVYEGTVPLYS